MDSNNMCKQVSLHHRITWPHFKILEPCLSLHLNTSKNPKKMCYAEFFKFYKPKKME